LLHQLLHTSRALHQLLHQLLHTSRALCSVKSTLLISRLFPGREGTRRNRHSERHRRPGEWAINRLNRLVGPGEWAINRLNRLVGPGEWAPSTQIYSDLYNY
jgi:hypothetical protein